ncbi:Uncharacterized protein FKW44_023421 [Caligus rogercresseyi]|uniref:F-box domain-containing protein n=1 Tax=Caligus rogercresseyi TaxID=217165 RepID=A0A7T8GPE5_CALRO|nr:Uncharacterized protein FKW44_023421 [Caligus rogercresseyi]
MFIKKSNSIRNKPEHTLSHVKRQPHQGPNVLRVFPFLQETELLPLHELAFLSLRLSRRRGEAHTPPQSPRPRPLLHPLWGRRLILGFPSLSCSKCNSLFHPLCVGLGDGHSYAGYDFVCSACAPPGEKENSAPNKKKNGPAVSFSPVVTPSRVNNSSANNNNSNTSSSNPRSGVTVNRAHGPGQSQSSTQQERHHKAPPPPNLPLRPIETQSVVNIAGNKYLVVPQGGKAPERPTKRKSHQGNSSSSGGSHANSHNIPVLLKPYSGSDQLPSFEVEETSDGRLQLLPISSTGLDKVLKRKKKEPEEESSPDTKRFCRDFISNLSSAYYALVHVFKYLSTQERIQVSRVCRLWRDLVLHPSLWKSISLKVGHI